MTPFAIAVDGQASRQRGLLRAFSTASSAEWANLPAFIEPPIDRNPSGSRGTADNPMLGRFARFLKKGTYYVRFSNLDRITGCIGRAGKLVGKISFNKHARR